jgi:hypothetical protein
MTTPICTDCLATLTLDHEVEAKSTPPMEPCCMCGQHDTRFSTGEGRQVLNLASDPRRSHTLIGHQYIARKPCGKVVALCWDDAGQEKETAKSVARWIARGDKVERVARHKDDPMPEWSCPTSESCECRTPTVA